MNRRSIILLLIGTIAAIAGFAVPAYLRQRRCAAAGGRWDNAARQCAASDGGVVEVASGTDILVGALVAVALAFMLFRMFLFATGRVGRSMEQ